ncbi:MAG: hypothetical protein ACLFVD_01735 [Dehalococcoidia bacterium]
MAYLDGLFVAAVIMGQLCAEGLLRTLYRQTGADDKLAKHVSFRTLIEGAASRAWIDA